MPKSESVKFRKEEEDDPPEKESSASASGTGALGRSCASRSKEEIEKAKGQLSVGLAARLKKRVVDTRTHLDEENPEHIKRKEWKLMRKQVYQMLEHPRHSNTSFAVCALIFFMIILSTVFCCAETLPVLETPFWRQFFWTSDVVFVVFFTLEYLIRYWASDNRSGFVWKPLNIIDLVALIPFYIELIVWMLFTSAHSNGLFRALQLIRVLRFIRVGKFSADMQFIGEGLSRSGNSFLIMFYMLSVGMLLCSVCLFMMERGEWDSKKGCFVREPKEPFFTGCSPFESVPLSAWWAITTMTTVGFGDVFPLSLAGRIAAALTMVLGLLTVAIPTTVLGVEFALAYKQQLAERKATKVRKTLTARHRDELILHSSMQRFNNLIEEFRVHLPYVKHLAMADLELADEHASLDPTFTIFKNNVMNDLTNLKFFVDASTSGLVY